MSYRIITYSYPVKPPNNDFSIISELQIPITKQDMSIYETVDVFEKEFKKEIIFYKKEKKEKNEKIKNNQKIINFVELRSIINLHNDDGIKDIEQIKSMVQRIKAGDEVLSENGLPNIKLVKARDGGLVLFDGHHSLLAYMVSGRKFLHEVPHLIVLDGENGFVDEQEIVVFFGKHMAKLDGLDWRRYVVNWQANEAEQLCSRVQKNIGELFDSMLQYF